VLWEWSRFRVPLPEESNKKMWMRRFLGTEAKCSRDITEYQSFPEDVNEQKQSI